MRARQHTTYTSHAAYTTTLIRGSTASLERPGNTWTAPISPDHCERVLVVRSVKAFVLTWRQVAQARMEPLLIIHVIDEAPNLSLGIGERLVVIEIDLLDSLNANDKTVAVARHG